ncbi:DUF1413 domain-containing protein [Alloyangia pacifica]|uniref:DUF1413 domain-containing protein n=1 Tax=Alloyangia pacifica TaxID=311180 RepID=UPI001CFCB52D|nr:DUF1413 domain-containing protein [Alloyangia pacifica]
MDDDLLNRLRRDAQGLPQGKFHFPALYGAGWEDLWIGDKVKIGRAFLKAVRAGQIPDVEDSGHKVGGGRVYRKI